MYNNGQTTAGVTVPDTKLARDATELVRESTTDLIYNHSRRVYWFGSPLPAGADIRVTRAALRRSRRAQHGLRADPMSSTDAAPKPPVPA
jgi:hypothetical protein